MLPTGQNLYAVDPRSVPTRTAWELGQRAAQEFLSRYVQDHGDWPKKVVFDLWGSAAMRTGGEDLAQAFALIGARPVWDHASNRVSGFEVLEIAALGRPRVDVTVRISGLFRDVFPEQIALYDSAVKAIAARTDEAAKTIRWRKPHSARARMRACSARRPAPTGPASVRRALSENFDTRENLGAAYLEATGYAYEGDDRSRDDEFRERVTTSQAFVHVQDMPGQDVLDSDAFADHEGGFAAAAEGVRRDARALSSRRDRPPRRGAHTRGRDRAGAARARRQSALDRRADAPRISRRGRNRRKRGQSVRLRRDDRRASPTGISTCCSTPSAATQRCATSSSKPIRRPRRR